MNINAQIQRARDTYARTKQYLGHDIWHIGKPGEEIKSGFLVKQLRVGILLFKGMFEETLLLRASALTFTTLLFIVPFLVFMFSIIQTFHLGDHIYAQVSNWLDTQITQISKVVEVVKFNDDEAGGESGAARGDAGAGRPGDRGPRPSEPAASDAGDTETAAGASGGEPSQPPGPESRLADLLPEDATAEEAAGAVGDAADMAATARDQQFIQDLLGALFPTMAADIGEGELFDPVNFLVDMVEDKATDLRTLGLTGLMYVLITVLGLMRNVEWSFNQIWGVNETRNLRRTLSDYIIITLLLPFVAAIMLGITAALTTNDAWGSLSILLRGSQALVISLTFAILYYFVPNTTVQPKCALMGGLLAGIAWTLTAWAYVTFSVGLAKYTFFFSAFALVPMLLAWIYTSWVILLFGALVTFAYQNEKTFALERLANKASHAYREAVAVRVMIELARRFAKGEPAVGVTEMAETCNVPSRLVNEALETLSEAGLVTTCATDPVTYQPSRAAETIQVIDILNALREDGEDPSGLREEDAYKDLYAGLGMAASDVRAATVGELVAKRA